jgi:hypothetical protein
METKKKYLNWIALFCSVITYWGISVAILFALRDFTGLTAWQNVLPLLIILMLLIIASTFIVIKYLFKRFYTSSQPKFIIYTFRFLIILIIIANMVSIHQELFSPNNYFLYDIFMEHWGFLFFNLFFAVNLFRV